VFNNNNNNNNNNNKSLNSRNHGLKQNWQTTVTHAVHFYTKSPTKLISCQCPCNKDTNSSTICICNKVKRPPSYILQQPSRGINRGNVPQLWNFTLQTRKLNKKNWSEVIHLMPKFGGVSRRSQLKRYPNTNLSGRSVTHQNSYGYRITHPASPSLETVFLIYFPYLHK